MTLLGTSWALTAALLTGCGTPSAEPPAPVQAAPPQAAEAEQPVQAAEVEPSKRPPAAKGGVRVLHHRMNKGRRTPKHVSATWVADGLQVMITGFTSSCEPAPTFSLVSAAGVVRLVADEQKNAARCPGTHTMMLQIDGLAAQDVEVEVLDVAGKEFGSVELKATDH